LGTNRKDMVGQETGSFEVVLAACCTCPESDGGGEAKEKDKDKDKEKEKEKEKGGEKL
jgi:hypothetical protein